MALWPYGRMAVWRPWSRQEVLRESVTRFSVFMKENDAKRARANKKTQEEIKQREAKAFFLCRFFLARDGGGGGGGGGLGWVVPR